jgi:two-component system response regulator FixJ
MRFTEMGEATLDHNSMAWSSAYQDVKPVNEIFVVDDDEDMRNILAATLSPEGVPVTTFEDGDSFLRAAKTRVPLCVFLDVVMPQRSGLEILEELRAQKFRTPIFIVSACNDVQTIVEAMKNGADDYIRKPFDHHAARLRVRNAVAKWSYHGQDRSAADVYANQNCEWFLLTPQERDTLLFNRVIDAYS